MITNKLTGCFLYLFLIGIVFSTKTVAQNANTFIRNLPEGTILEFKQEYEIPAYSEKLMLWEAKGKKPPKEDVSDTLSYNVLITIHYKKSKRKRVIREGRQFILKDRKFSGKPYNTTLELHVKDRKVKYIEVQTSTVPMFDEKTDEPLRTAGKTYVLEGPFELIFPEVEDF